MIIFLKMIFRIQEQAKENVKKKIIMAKNPHGEAFLCLNNTPPTP